MTFRGLSKYSHLDVQVFESAAKFREQGAGILLQTTATWVLELMGLKQCLIDAGAVPLNPTRTMIGTGPDSGKFLFEVGQGERPSYNVHRSALLEQIYKGIDGSRMHAGKKLTKLEKAGEEIQLHFEDGTTHVCDVVLGADGIRSKTRAFVVPADDPAANPVFTGLWSIWQMAPTEKAVECLGSELINVKDPRQYGWAGDGGFLMHDLMSDNKMAQYIVSFRVEGEDPADVKDWKRTVTQEQLRKILAGWEPPLEKGMFDIIAYNETKSKEPTTAISIWHQWAVPKISEGCIALVGDAAGATSPWQASGSGMALQDAFLLSGLFAHVTTAKEANAALKAYNSVNRPIREGIIRSSYETVRSFTDRIQRWAWILMLSLGTSSISGSGFMALMC